MRAVFVFCEGKHDVVFARRSLRILGECTPMNRAVGDLPTPFGANGAAREGFVAFRFRQRQFEDLNLAEMTRPPSPSIESILENADRETIFIFVSTNGKNKRKDVIDMLKSLDEIFEEADDGGFAISRYACAFLLDADEQGMARTLEEFRAGYSAYFGDMAQLEHAKWLPEGNVPVGCFIFYDPGDEKERGTLETHLASIAKAAWPERFTAAQKFVQDNQRVGDAVVGDREEHRARRIKAVVTSAGQFHHPGAALTVVIGQEDLPDRQFRESPVSQSLVDFLLRAP